MNNSINPSKNKKKKTLKQNSVHRNHSSITLTPVLAEPLRSFQNITSLHGEGTSLLWPERLPKRLHRTVHWLLCDVHNTYPRRPLERTAHKGTFLVFHDDTGNVKYSVARLKMLLMSAAGSCGIFCWAAPHIILYFLLNIVHWSLIENTDRLGPCFRPRNFPTGRSASRSHVWGLLSLFMYGYTQSWI